MEVRFTPEQEAQLSQIANLNGTNAEQLVRQATLRIVEEEAQFKGVSSAVSNRPTGANTSRTMKSSIALKAFFSQNDHPLD